MTSSSVILLHPSLLFELYLFTIVNNAFSFVIFVTVFLCIVVYHACLLSLDMVKTGPASRGEFNVYVLYVNFHVFLVVVLVMYL